MIPTDTRNVIDYYKNWELEAIRADLDKKRSPMINLVCNLTSDFNKSSVIRANNAFLGSKVIIAGNKKWDRRGAVGTHHYEHLEYWSDPLEAISHYINNENYWVIPVDNTPEFKPLSIYKAFIPKRVMFVYGEEQLGLSANIVEICTHGPIYIPTQGSTRSINVAQAAAICMYEYNRQYVI